MSLSPLKDVLEWREERTNEPLAIQGRPRVARESQNNAVIYHIRIYVYICIYVYMYICIYVITFSVSVGEGGVSFANSRMRN